MPKNQKSKMPKQSREQTRKQSREQTREQSQKQTIVTGNYYDKKNTGNPIARRLVARFDRALEAAISGLEARNIVEIGCGEGNVIPLVKTQYPATRYTAIDIDPNLLEMAARQGADRTILADPAEERYPLKDGSADLILLVEVLEHLDEPEPVLKEISRLAADKIIITVPYEPWWRLLNMLRGKYLGAFGNTPGHVNHFSPGGLRKTLAPWMEIQSLYAVFPWIFVEGQKKHKK